MTVFPEGKTSKIAVERLELDRENPRLIADVSEATDETIIALLFREADLSELLQSMSTSGYMDIEPLVGMPATANGNRVVVLEGNRRLAALRLLREPALVTRLRASENINITVPPLDPALRPSFDSISVHLVAQREEARSFIAFKHINGPAKWNAYAKARYAAEWYRREKSRGITINGIARSIGDRHDTIKRMVFAIYVLDQASEKQCFDIEDRSTVRFSLSHLYTALGRSPYMQYLGLEPNWSAYDPSPNPVPDAKLGALRQVLVWIYGSKSADARSVVRSQNPDIRRLGEVLSNAEGLHVLETTRSLDAAHAVTEPVDRRFIASLMRAREAIRECVSSLRAFDGRDDSLVDVAEDVKETSASLWLTMVRKSRNAMVDK